jgi:protein PhnA
MSLEKELLNRSNSKCELCGAFTDLKVFEVPPVSSGGVDGSLLACSTCLEQVENPDVTDPNHWRCLNDSMWSEFPAVKVVVYRMLSRLRKEGWPQDLLDMMHLDDDVLAWANSMGEGIDESEKVIHKDSNGVILEAGDSVILIKDLPVRGSSMVAKRGTAVRRISLDTENADYIEGKVDGQQIMIITKFVKKI